MTRWSKNAYYSDYCDLPSWVYRLYNEAGDLLYVGMSTNPTTRALVHRSRQPWGKEIASYSIERYESREAAKAGETYATHHENPLYNLTRPRMECC